MSFANLLAQRGSFVTHAAMRDPCYYLRCTFPGGFQRYYFVLVERLKERMFLNVIKGSEGYNITDYGTILATGMGEAAQDLKDRMARQYRLEYK